MAKEKDITEKQLEALNDVFADIINALIFNGRQVVKEDELEPAMPQSQFKAGGVIHEQERDVAKFWKNGCIRLALYGTANQTDVDQDMPLWCLAMMGHPIRSRFCSMSRQSGIGIPILSPSPPIRQSLWCCTLGRNHGMDQQRCLSALESMSRMN